MGEVDIRIKKRALIVGINEYSHPAFNKLDFAEADAREMHSLLSDKTIGEFDDVVSLGKGATKLEFEISLARTLKEAQAEDLVLVYFAGHGALDASDQLCLVTTDTQYDVLRWSGVPLENINQMIADSKCRSVVLMLDCCYSGPQDQSFRSGQGLTESFKRFSERDDPATKIIISAAQGDEKAREIARLGHGVFTHFVLQGMKEEADSDIDGYVTVDELFDYVYDKVKTETNQRQKPCKWGADKDRKIRLSKNVKTLAKRNADEGQLKEQLAKLLEFYDRFDDFTPAIFKETTALLKRLYPSLDFREKKKRGLVLNLFSPETNEGDVKEFRQNWERLKEIEEAEKKKQAVQPKLGELLGDPSRPAREEEQPTLAKTETPQRAARPIEPQTTSEPRPSPAKLQEFVGDRFPQADAPSTSRDLVFISYSHDDQEWLNEIKKMLAPFQARGLDIWDDHDIPSGAHWKEAIKKALVRTKVAVLLVSKNFLSSDFIRNHELPSLLKAEEKNGLTVLWVPVSYCAYAVTEIGEYQSVHDPEQPLTKLKNDGQDKLDAALVHIAQEIDKAAFKRSAARP